MLVSIAFYLIGAISAISHAEGPGLHSLIPDSYSGFTFESNNTPVMSSNWKLQQANGTNTVYSKSTRFMGKDWDDAGRVALIKGKKGDLEKVIFGHQGEDTQSIRSVGFEGGAVTRVTDCQASSHSLRLVGYPIVTSKSDLNCLTTDAAICEKLAANMGLPPGASLRQLVNQCSKLESAMQDKGIAEMMKTAVNGQAQAIAADSKIFELNRTVKSREAKGPAVSKPPPDDQMEFLVQSCSVIGAKNQPAAGDKSTVNR